MLLRRLALLLALAACLSAFVLSTSSSLPGASSPALASAAPSVGTALETPDERLARRRSLKERATSAYDRRVDRKTKLANQIAGRQRTTAQTASAASARKAARLQRLRKQQQIERDAERLALRIADASKPATLAAGRKRARELIKKYLDNVARPGPAGKTLLELSPRDTDEYVLKGTRMYSLLLMVSGRDYYEDCQPCRHTHEIVVATSERLEAAQRELFNSIAKAPASESPLALPINVLDADARPLPVVPVAIDATTYMDFLRANKIQGVPLVMVVLPTMDAASTPMPDFMESVHSTHMWRYPNSGATNDSISPFLTNLFNVRAQHTDAILAEKSADGSSAAAADKSKNLELTDVQSAQNPLALFFQSIPLWTLVAASWGLVLAAALLFRHVSLLLTLLHALKPLVLLVAVAGWAFNISGGLFIRTSGDNFIPGHLRSAAWKTLWTDPPRWVAQGFREQHGVEGAILTVLLVAFTAAATLLVLLAMRKETKKISAANGKEVETKRSIVRVIFDAVWFVVFGIIVPAALFAVAVVLFLHFVRMFLHKMGGYVEDVMWSYAIVAKYINRALTALKIPAAYKVPKYLVRNLG